MTTSFNFDFTPEKVTAMIPTNKQATDWFNALADALSDYDIYSVERCAAFFAQTAHESADFTHLHENLNYKSASLITTWPKRFNAGNADAYAHQPEKIANYVYANRMGNGNETSGEGYKYRGRGILQVTGKDNYRACSMAIFNDDRLITQPELLETSFDAAVRSACWFWERNNLNTVADTGDIKQITQIVNGGLLGLDDRTQRYNSALTILAG